MHSLRGRDRDIAAPASCPCGLDRLPELLGLLVKPSPVGADQFYDGGVLVKGSHLASLCGGGRGLPVLVQRLHFL